MQHIIPRLMVRVPAILVTTEEDGAAYDTGLSMVSHYVGNPIRSATRLGLWGVCPPLHRCIARHNSGPIVYIGMDDLCAHACLAT